MDSMLAPGDLQSSGDTEPTVGKHGNFWRFHGHRGVDCGFDGGYRGIVEPESEFFRIRFILIRPNTQSRLLFLNHGHNQRGRIMRGDIVELVHIRLGFAIRLVAQASDDQERRFLLVAGLRDGGAFHFSSRSI